MCACVRVPCVVLCLLTSPLELPCHAGLVKVGIGPPWRDTRTDRRRERETERTVDERRLYCDSSSVPHRTLTAGKRFFAADERSGDRKK